MCAQLHEICACLAPPKLSGHLACMLAGRSAEAKGLKILQQSISKLLLEHEHS